MMQLVWRRAWRAQVSTTVVVGVRYYYVQVCSSARQVPASMMMGDRDRPGRQADRHGMGPWMARWIGSNGKVGGAAHLTHARLRVHGRHG